MIFEFYFRGRNSSSWAPKKLSDEEKKKKEELRFSEYLGELKEK